MHTSRGIQIKLYSRDLNGTRIKNKRPKSGSSSRQRNIWGATRLPKRIINAHLRAERRRLSAACVHLIEREDAHHAPRIEPVCVSS